MIEEMSVLTVQIYDIFLPQYSVESTYCDMVLNAARRSSVTSDNNLNLPNKRAALMSENFFIVIELSTHGTVYLILHSLHQLIILK